MKKGKNKIPDVDNSPPIIPNIDQKLKKKVSDELIKGFEWYFPNEHSTYKELINRWYLAQSFTSLLKRRNNHLKKLENPKEKFKNNVQNKVKQCENILNVIIDRWIEHDFELIDEMKAFKPTLRSESDKYIQQDNYEDIEKLQKDYEGVNNQLNVANKKVIKYRRQARFKAGQITDKELEKMADSVRFKSRGKINYRKLGMLLGCSDNTAKHTITQRLPYLLDSKDY